MRTAQGTWGKPGKHARDNPPGNKAHQGDNWAIAAEQRDRAAARRARNQRDGYARQRAESARIRELGNIEPLLSIVDKYGIRLTLF